MGGRISQIDFIFVNKECRNSLCNSEVCICFTSMDSDHRLVPANLKVSLQTSKTTRKMQYEGRNIFKEFKQFILTNSEAPEPLVPKQKRAKRNRRSVNGLVEKTRFFFKIPSGIKHRK